MEGKANWVTGEDDIDAELISHGQVVVRSNEHMSSGDATSVHGEEGFRALELEAYFVVDLSLIARAHVDRGAFFGATAALSTGHLADEGIPGLEDVIAVAIELNTYACLLVLFFFVLVTDSVNDHTGDLEGAVNAQGLKANSNEAAHGGWGVSFEVEASKAHVEAPSFDG